jgi:hypothetical protein
MGHWPAACVTADGSVRMKWFGAGPMPIPIQQGDGVQAALNE